MHLVELLLPIYDNNGKSFSKSTFDQVRVGLTERFGGVTAFLRAPAEGLWTEGEGQVSRDDLVILQVMTDVLDRDWWAEYRKRLEKLFRQDEVVIRATVTERL
jgi:hypothetical protein